MRFGGHETFPVRTGWLSKGLDFLRRCKGASLHDTDAADELGVGRNMAKSIRYWLLVTRLAERPDHDEALTLSALGRLVLRHDPYLQQTATWWALHLNVATQPDAATTWRWFFNDFARARFDRGDCTDELQRALERNMKRLPSPKTLARDVACLLQTYSTPLPATAEDPEDATDCPFRRLGLIVHHLDTGYFERRFTSRSVPPELLGYALALTRDDPGGGHFALSLTGALASRFGPAKLFALDADGLAALADDAERLLGSDRAHSYLLGAERMLAIEAKPQVTWLTEYYERVAA